MAGMIGERYRGYQLRVYANDRSGWYYEWWDGMSRTGDVEASYALNPAAVMQDARCFVNARIDAEVAAVERGCDAS